MNTLRIGVLVGCVLALGFIVDATRGKARAHDIYDGPEWKVPNNPAVSCCNNTDCRATRAYVGEDGLWRAWTGAKWLTVPADRLLPTDLAKDGRAHLCEKLDFIYCFSPSEPKS